MENIRHINKIIKPRPTMEGAGVLLKRVFGFNELNQFDPFLLMDNFGSSNPKDYTAGFPWHPHRGIETVTYMLEGTVEHGDSLGNSGIISSGDIQWMTAGSGIIHQEMPKEYKGTMRGFQLWVNLPAALKMMKPRYQDVPAANIPYVKPEDGIHVKVIAGEFNGVKGPVKDIIADPMYLDINLNPGKTLEIPVHEDYTVIAYVYEGSGYFGDDTKNEITAGHLVHLTDGEAVRVDSIADNLKLIFISGKPLKEPVAWRGPIVMNTDEELQQAFFEYRNGTFIK